MNPLVPFAYPASPHMRRHGPQGYKAYGDYKPFLRDEFTFRCVYCLERERWYPNRESSISVAHFVPKAIAPERDGDYENLVYACVRRNSFKQAAIMSLDPAKVAFSEHFLVRDDGRIDGLSLEAEALILLLDLNRDPALGTRRRALRILRLKAIAPSSEDIQQIFLDAFAFPENLPDLAALRPPEGNIRSEGIKGSYFEQRKNGSLPEFH